MNKERNPAIDALRGFAVICMVIGNFMMGLTWFPTWLKHAPDIGFTFVDLGAPAFVFIIGLNYVASVQRRLDEDGTRGMIQHFVVRYFAILGLGALFGAGQVLLKINGETINWGVLQAIGVAGLVTLSFIRLPSWTRLLIGLSLLAGYQTLLDRIWLANVLDSPHGGMFGSLSWAGLLILATVLADLYHRQPHGWTRLLIGSGISIALALILNMWVVISKNRVSAPYVLLTLGLSGWFFCLFQILVERFRWKMSLFLIWGRNPLLLYVLHLFLQGLLTLPFATIWGASPPPWLVFTQEIFLVGILSLLAMWLDKRKIYISL